MRHPVCLCAFILAAAPAHAADPPPYVGIIDAGSSASRLHVYKFVAGEQAVEDVLEASSASPPLAAHAGHPETAGDRALGPLLRALDGLLAERAISKTDIEIHVLATGGMRLLAAPVAQKIEASARRAIAEGGYRAGRIETISGEAEGFYAWLDVNMLLGRLGVGQTTAGIVEIGGASMQVAYAGAAAGAPGVVTASFGGATWSVRSISLLGLGIEQARKTLMDSGDGGACFPEGVVSAMPGPGAARDPFDAGRCASAFARVTAAPTRSLEHDEIKGMPFIGLGRPLTGVLADWKLPLDRPAAMKEIAREKCVLPWPEFTRLYGDTPFTPYLCANSIYLSTLLFDGDGLGFAAGQVVVADRIAGRRPYWTRGAALMLRN